MKKFNVRDLVIQAWDRTEPCPDADYATRVCPSCVAKELSVALRDKIAVALLTLCEESEHNNGCNCGIIAAKIVQGELGE